VVLALVVWAAVKNERQEHDFLAIPSDMITKKDTIAQLNIAEGSERTVLTPCR